MSTQDAYLQVIKYQNQGWTGQHFFASGRGGAGDIFLGQGRDKNSLGGAGRGGAG